MSQGETLVGGDVVLFNSNIVGGETLKRETKQCAVAWWKTCHAMVKSIGDGGRRHLFEAIVGGDIAWGDNVLHIGNNSGQDIDGGRCHRKRHSCGETLWGRHHGARSRRVKHHRRRQCTEQWQPHGARGEDSGA